MSRYISEPIANGLGGGVVSGHTPGPWVAAKDPSGVATVAWCGEWRIGPDTGHGDPNMADYADHGDDEPDAKLIAAAPDLAEALLGVLRVADRDTDEFAAARAALAKAGVS